MLNGLKTSIAVLLGLILGALVSLPLAWTATRRGADALVHNIEKSVAVVEERQQAMADQALRLEPLLVSKGWHEGSDIFEKVQEARSVLAGQAPLRDKLANVQELEQALLLSEKVWEQAGENRALAASYYYAEHGRMWEKQKRLLVREQMELLDSVHELNSLLQHWPASVLLGYKSVGAMINAFLGDVMGNITFTIRVGLDWLGYGVRRLAAVTGQQAPPETPKWERPKAKAAVAYIDPMVPPHFLADAPLPEDQYREVQFEAEGENYADVDVGEDKTVLENRHAPDKYKLVLPKPQATVTYK
jgi:hypothetical protein